MEKSSNKYDDQGSAYWRNGHFEEAISNWIEAVKSYEREEKRREQCHVLDKLSQAYQAIGQLHKSIETLEAARELAEKTGDRHQLASVLGHFGNVHLIFGELDLAQHYMDEAIKISRELGDDELSAAILNNLGNLYASQKKFGEAVAYYKESLELTGKSKTHSLSATALINHARAAMQLGLYDKTKVLLDQALDEGRQMQDSHDKAYGLTSIGISYSELRNHFPGLKSELFVLAYGAFNEAVDVAERINDNRAASYAQGYLGKLYEDEHQYQDALQLTRRAIFAAQQASAPESLYRWQWQTGRLFKRLGKIDNAISAYRRSVYTLQSTRQEMDRCYGNPQSSFRKTAGYICFELVNLLLQRSATTENHEECEALLMEARDIVELLRVYELRNYFNDDCVDAARSKTVRLDTISRTTAVVYPILLKDRTELLVSLPSGLKRFSVKVGKDEMTKEIREFRTKLEKRTTWEFLPHAQRLYDNLIRPMEPDLSSNSVDTLVFVPGGSLRTIPVAALHDGKRFLIDKYATAITPGLNLTDPSPIDREHIKVLAAGLTQPVQGFPPLPYVEPELKVIRDLYECESLVNQDFLLSKVQKALRDEAFNILHIASHGKFQSDVDKTFILTFDDKLTMNKLDEYVGLLQFRKEPLDLLTLSACETAVGDDLAALGIAGLAIKAGARSALATLWHINDLATSILVEEFYREIGKPSISRAVALQQAQLKLLRDARYEHPGYWSPFLLINNWL